MPDEISPLLQEYLEKLISPKLKNTLLGLLAGNLDPSEEEIRRALTAMGAKFNNEEESRRKNIEAFPWMAIPLTPEQEKEIDRDTMETIEQWRRRLEEIGNMPPEEQEKHLFEALAMNQELNLYEFLIKRRSRSSTD